MGSRGQGRLPRRTTRERRMADTQAVTLATTSGLVLDYGGLTVVVQSPLDIDGSGVKLDIQSPLDSDGSGLKLVFGTGLRDDSGTLKTKDDEIVHDNLSGYSASKHISIGSVTPIGDGGTLNYTLFQGNGDLSFVGTAGFYPRLVLQSAEPTAGTGTGQCDTGELILWKDSDDSKNYLCYNDGGTIKKVELT